LSAGRKTHGRTCIACRQVADKPELVRVVRAVDGFIHIDPSGKVNGRGAYVHPRQQCFDAAIRRRRFDHALKVRLQEDDTDKLLKDFERLKSVIESDAHKEGDSS